MSVAHREATLRWRREHRAKYLAGRRRWREKNRDKINAAKRAARAAKHEARYESIELKALRSTGLRASDFL